MKCNDDECSSYARCQFAHRVLMFVQHYMHMRNRVPGRVTPATCASGLENLPRFLPTVHFART